MIATPLVLEMEFVVIFCIARNMLRSSKFASLTSFGFDRWLDLVEQSTQSKWAKGLAMDVFGPGIGNSASSANSIYKSLTSLQISCVIGMFTYFWIVDFPENAEQSFHFLDKEESELAVKRIQQDRGDVIAAPFSWYEVLSHFLDAKIYAFAVMFFLLVSGFCTSVRD